MSKLQTGISRFVADECGNRYQLIPDGTIGNSKIGDVHIEIAINKEEILRDLDEIQKKAEEVWKLLEKFSAPTYPSYPAYPYWPNPDTTDGKWIVTCESVSIGDSSVTGETTTYATAPSTPTGD